MVNASQVKQLREKTGAGMMDCKKALLETQGELDLAVDWLKKKGLSTAAKKASRIAADGLAAVALEARFGVVVEVNCETDFVAKNQKFQLLVADIVKLALGCQDLKQLEQAIMPNSKSVLEEITDHIIILGENIKLRRLSRLAVPSGIIASYIHNSAGECSGKIVVLVGLESLADKLQLAELGKKIAMHIAATSPQSLSITELDAQLVENERAIFAERFKIAGHSEKMVEKLVNDRVSKFYQEVVLLEQNFVMNNKLTITELITNTARELNSPITLTGFIRYELGEGLVHEEKNFVDEVAALSNAGDRP